MLLIIDKAPCHSSCKLLDRENGLFRVFKKRYKKEILQRIVLPDADGDDLVSQLRSINLKDCCYMIAQAWDSMSGSTLRGNEKDQNNDVDVSDKPNEGPSHSEAYSCLTVGLKWMEKQKEFSATQLMLMRQTGDVVAKNKLSSFKYYIEYDSN
ncbi:hypothetical protein T11_4891 [Trichinella zimbabwensis]|uniref:DDE-1 domain-containing protein n=1 Tax=Trichinella zimbabwensis TaxID=268475 RepID=A0A0V1GZM2_9BILA|nr:hypothetical protein T11_4891 [Trichinella zimbabwensis]